MCSSALGPARAPSLVMCPMRRTGTPSRLAKTRSSAAQSRIWLMLPGMESEASLDTVWIESTITTDGRRLPTWSRIRFQASLSQQVEPRPLDPQAVAAKANLLHGLLSGHVEDGTAPGSRGSRPPGAGGSNLPIPGSPPSRIREPGTIPPPRVRSTSGLPVVIRCSPRPPDLRISVRRHGRSGFARSGDLFLLQGVPVAAGGATAEPLGTLEAALAADVQLLERGWRHCGNSISRPWQLARPTRRTRHRPRRQAGFSKRVH